jgi:hypothetical protein
MTICHTEFIEGSQEQNHKRLSDAEASLKQHHFLLGQSLITSPQLIQKTGVSAVFDHFNDLRTIERSG